MIPPSQQLNLHPALEAGSQPLNHQGSPSSSCFELGLKEVLISSMKGLAKGANNTLQIDPIMKYNQPRKSPSFKGKWAVLTDDVSTVEQAGPSWAQGFTGGSVLTRSGQGPAVYRPQSLLGLLSVQGLNTGLLFTDQWPIAVLFVSYKLFQKYFKI